MYFTSTYSSVILFSPALLINSKNYGNFGLTFYWFCVNIFEVEKKRWQEQNEGSNRGRRKVERCSGITYEKIAFTRSLYLQMGCFLLWSCLTLCDPLDCSPPGCSVHGILQARIPEWVAIAFSRRSLDPGIKPTSHFSCLHWQVGFFFFFLPIVSPEKPCRWGIIAFSASVHKRESLTRDELLVITILLGLPWQSSDWDSTLPM